MRISHDYFENATRLTTRPDRGILLLGEVNPLGSTPEYALYPDPPGCSGWRLCYKIFDVSTADYLSLWRTNMCVDGWSQRAAGVRASALLRVDAPWSTIIMLGRKVAGVMSPVCGAVAPFEQSECSYGAGGKRLRFVSLPHPSGMNRAWNDPSAVTKAREIFCSLECT